MMETLCRTSPSEIKQLLHETNRQTWCCGERVFHIIRCWPIVHVEGNIAEKLPKTIVEKSVFGDCADNLPITWIF